MTSRANQLAASTAQPIPRRVEPMMLGHLLLTGDVEQQRKWRTQLERIRQADAIETAHDPQTKALLANQSSWIQMRSTGRIGATLGMGLGTMWMAWLIPAYAVGHGFGWFAALTYLLPVPLAWRIGRRLWEQASLAGMRDLGKRPTWRRRLRTWGRGLLRSFGAGFGFGFSLTFLQGLISWFMTPEPTIVGELLADGAFGTLAGMISGTFAVMLTPLVSRAAPELPGGSATKALPSGEL